MKTVRNVGWIRSYWHETTASGKALCFGNSIKSTIMPCRGRNAWTAVTMVWSSGPFEIGLNEQVPLCNGMRGMEIFE